MIARRILAAIALLCLFAAPAYAQKTKAAIVTEIPLLCPANQTTGQCTATNAQQLWSDLVNAIMPTAPVVTGNLACWNGTTGLLKDCGNSPATTGLTVGTSTITSGTNGRVVFDNSGIIGEYVISGSGNVCMTTSCVMTTPNIGTPSAGTLTNATGLPTTGLTGTLQAAQEPAHTGDCTNSAGSLALTCLSTNGTAFTATATAAAGQLPATATNDSASAGKVGEIFSQNILVGSAVGLSNNTAANVATITPTAGDWDIAAEVCFHGAATTVTSVVRASISTTTATENTTSPNFSAIGYPASSAVFSTSDICFAIAPNRQSLSGSQQFWLVAFSNFATSTLSAYGQIRARRVR